MPLPRTTVLLAGWVILSTQTAVTTTLPSTVRWSVEIPASPAASPVVDNDAVYVVLQSGLVVAHRVSDGKEMWKASLRSDLPVAVEGGRVYVVAGEAIHALNAADGIEVWLSPSGQVTAPLVAHEGWVIAATTSGLTAFRSGDGKKMWSREAGLIQLPATIDGNNLYVPVADGRLLALNLATGGDQWAKAWGVNSEVLALSGRLCFGAVDRFFYCVVATTGARDWRHKLGAPVRGRPVADDKRIFVASMDNTIRAYRRSNGALLWHPSVPYRPTTGPVLIANGVVVPGKAAELRAFDAATGRASGQITLPSELLLPPVFGRSADVAVMAAFTGNLNGQWKLVLTAPPAPTPEALPE